MLAVETLNLTKCFGSFKAVDGLNLKVPEGSICGFLGPNGAGKTTTVKMLSGLSRPSAGAIRIYGNDVKFGSLKNRNNIGYLPDVPNFYDWMTPTEFLRFVGKLFSIDMVDLDKRINELLELVVLKDSNKRIGGFSRGMKQRLGIAQALINNPKVILLDEPTSALDPVGRKEVMDVIAALSGRVTVFFSTHILADIERVCDRIIILDKGRMRIEDTIDNLRAEYSLRCIEIETDNALNLKVLMDALQCEKWVKQVIDNQAGQIKVYVEDMHKAQKAIPRILYEKDIGLRKLNPTEPTLEDIFLKVVNE